jgi:hypothetical protein
MDGAAVDRAALEALQKEVADLRAKVEQILRDLADRPDRAMIERLFEKFKGSLANVADMIKRGQADDKHYATMDDMKRLENLITSVNHDFEEAAAARKSTCCLSCGKPYRIVAGAITDEQTMAVLGAAPISHVTNEGKPCFVYGSDRELYYSATPRGRTFVAPNVGQPKSKPNQ